MLSVVKLFYEFVGDTKSMFNKILKLVDICFYHTYEHRIVID